MADETEVVENKGFLEASLKRSNKQIREERGEDVKIDLELVYKRDVEDAERDINRLERNRVKMFDFSVTNTQSLVMAKDLDALDIKEKDMAVRVEIRNAKIALGLSKSAYNFLFGDIYTINDDEK
jgi:hypothetical protein